MRINKEKLYEAFGELIYVVAMADGEIQETEVAALKKCYFFSFDFLPPNYFYFPFLTSIIVVKIIDRLVQLK